MTSFKQRLSEAIKSVFCEMNSLSEEVVRSEVNSYLNKNKTSVILYAWDNDITNHHDPIDTKFDWSRLLPISGNHMVNYCNISSSFTYKPINENLREDEKYNRDAASDDYFMYRAAA